MRAILLIILAVGFTSLSYGQQITDYSNFILNKEYYNPAIVGSRTVHMASVNYRKQWAGFDDAPSVFIGNFSGSVKNKGKIGYGISAISEKTGLTQNTSVYLNYAQHFKLSEKLKLGLGIKPGYMQYRVKLYAAVLADEGDQVLTGNVYTANALDVSAGFNLYSDKFFFMASAQRLLGKTITFTSYNSSLAFHYNAIVGYNFLIKKKNIEIQPSLLVKYAAPAAMQYTGMIKTTFNSKFWFGLLYKGDFEYRDNLFPVNSAGASLGITLKERFMIGYGYDYTLSKISSYQSGSHEIMLSFVISKKKPTLEEEDDKLNNSILEQRKKELEEKEKNK
tara:strand:- start:1221 stop:2225 length:1005 start_codon:yes stop_codon:yes gene_type:complete